MSDCFESDSCEEFLAPMVIVQHFGKKKKKKIMFSYLLGGKKEE